MTDTATEEPTTIEHLLSVFGRCHVCDADGGYTEAQLVAEGFDIDELLRYYDVVDDRMRDLFDTLGYTCNKCTWLKAEERDKRRRAVAAAKTELVAYQSEAMPAAATAHRFIHSDAATEARNPDAWVWARAWTPPAGNAWVYGLEGTGKTYLGHCVLNAALGQGVSAAQVTAYDFTHAARRFNGDERLKAFIKPGVLLLEDIDKGHWDEVSIQGLWNVLDKRHEAGRRLLVTANITGKEFAATVRAAWPGNTSVQGTMFARLQPIAGLTLEGESLRKVQPADGG
jgi:chromosomal replication initiation ATPase DnaA